VVVALAALWVPVRAFASGSRGGALAAPGAVRLVAPRGRPLGGRWQAWADASLVPTVRGRVTVRLTGCPHLPRAAGCVYTKQPRVVYLKRGVASARGVLMHELGHVFDLVVLNDRDRDRFQTIMHRPAWHWWSGSTPLAEWFAEGYSWCARYSRMASVARYAIYHYRPTSTQYSRVCALIRSAAAHNRAGAPPAQAPPVVTGDPAPRRSPRPPRRRSRRCRSRRSAFRRPRPPPTPTATPESTPAPPVDGGFGFPALPPFPAAGAVAELLGAPR
jgi:hypothetical protein